MTFSKEFKEALLNLPTKEKDKLLLRLLKKDSTLANRLYFELVEGNDVDAKRSEMEARVREQVAYAKASYHSPGYLMMDLRYLSGEINEHVKITKDKFGEISLNLLMLNEALEHAFPLTEPAPSHKKRKLIVYIIARAFKLLVLTDNIHEDYRLDLEDDMKKLGKLIGSEHSIMEEAIYHGLDVNWLSTFNIPEDIDAIHRELRSRGYLK
ncbi:hypothetical protein [Maribacter sp. 2307ULW6-5]|uniref:hypothetical protein n=1 Tax=Maribacter sp. 2307ULW6-5 TaxID=3386275 RepID=UPI0039BC39DA